jgi:hypothetical protein
MPKKRNDIDRIVIPQDLKTIFLEFGSNSFALAECNLLINSKFVTPLLAHGIPLNFQLQQSPAETAPSAESSALFLNL